ncbi:hypothetical protein Hdeb2414_s0218g00837181 [Helianthus debilis subsp. tardiflorus]
MAFSAIPIHSPFLIPSLREQQSAKYNPKCRVCNGSYFKENIWIYKCEKCIYYVHLDCATSASRREPFMSILSIGGDQNVKNFEDVDYP